MAADKLGERNHSALPSCFGYLGCRRAIPSLMRLWPALLALALNLAELARRKWPWRRGAVNTPPAGRVP